MLHADTEDAEDGQQVAGGLGRVDGRLLEAHEVVHAEEVVHELACQVAIIRGLVDEHLEGRDAEHQHVRGGEVAVHGGEKAAELHDDQEEGQLHGQQEDAAPAAQGQRAGLRPPRRRSETRSNVHNFVVYLC